MKVLHSIILTVCGAFCLWLSYQTQPKYSKENLAKSLIAENNVVDISLITGTSGNAFQGNIIRKYDYTYFDFSETLNLNITKQTCSVWAVVTTIFPPSDAIRLILNQTYCLVVVLDKKSDTLLWKFADNLTHVFILTVKKQQQIFPKFSQIIPFNHFGRKNIGYLFSILHGANNIWDFDDDNIGVPLLTLPIFSSIPTTAGISVNPYPFFDDRQSRIWPRGLPLENIKERLIIVDNKLTKNINVGVVQSLANNQPDVDAIFRFTREVPFNFNLNRTSAFLVPIDKFCPFNAQATLWYKQAFKYMILPITVHGRVSDIWRGYIMQKMSKQNNLHTLFVYPQVVQNRNFHRNGDDFIAEYPLYTKSECLLNHLHKQEFTDIHDLYISLYERGYVEYNDINLIKMWNYILEKYML
tara:strand:+ start:428 stop:1663 length:1236 start_codon:yes stop_codon:yes gene_type:complete